MKINILGSEWTIEYRNADTDPLLEENGGYADPSVNLIVVSNKRKGDDVLYFEKFRRDIFVMRLSTHFFLRAGWDPIWNTSSMAMRRQW